MFDHVEVVLGRLRAERPLILNITNAVTMDIVANGLLSLGASPIMSQAPQEIEELVELAAAVVINIGTLTDDFIELALQTCHIARTLNKPIILDPVGAGATFYRTTSAQRFLDECGLSIVRGNASEIKALAGGVAESKGVDATTHTIEAIEHAQCLARQYGLTVFMSGPVDVVVDSLRMQHIHRGSPLMPLVTGSGCLLSAVVGAFRAVQPDAFEASCLAGLFYAVSGELAAARTTSPGSFRAYFFDALHTKPQRGDYEHD